MYYLSFSTGRINKTNTHDVHQSYWVILQGMVYPIMSTCILESLKTSTVDVHLMGNCHSLVLTVQRIGREPIGLQAIYEYRGSQAITAVKNNSRNSSEANLKCRQASEQDCYFFGSPPVQAVTRKLLPFIGVCQLQFIFPRNALNPLVRRVSLS